MSRASQTELQPETLTSDLPWLQLETNVQPSRRQSTARCGDAKDAHPSALSCRTLSPRCVSCVNQHGAGSWPWGQTQTH